MPKCEDIENKTERELNWVEKRALKSFLKKVEKTLPQLKIAIEEGKKDKEEIIKILNDLNDLMEMEKETEYETPDGDKDVRTEPITTEDLQQMTIKELTDLLEEAIKYMKHNL